MTNYEPKPNSIPEECDNYELDETEKQTHSMQYTDNSLEGDQDFDENLHPSTHENEHKSMYNDIEIGTGKNSSNREPVKLHPFVHWAQSQSHISLRVDLTQAENLDVRIEKSDTDVYTLIFSANGIGSHGSNSYSFSVDLNGQVENKFDFHVIGRHVLILIKKSEEDQYNWPRLTKEPVKLPWLRVDFDRYITEEESDYNEDDYTDFEDLANQSLGKTDVDTNQPVTEIPFSESIEKIHERNNRENLDIFNPFNKSGYQKNNKMKHDYRREGQTVVSSRNSIRHALDYKRTYLFLYNLIMFIMFLKVTIILLIKSLGNSLKDDTVSGAVFLVKLLTYTQLLETLHPILGLVPGGPIMPLIQTTGRLIVCFFLADPIIRQSSAPYAAILLMVWSSIELFRYSFYALRVFKVNIHPITWCRYTLFIPLYPMGGICESLVLLSAIEQYEKTGQYSLDMPNSANISINLPILLRIYIYLVLGPMIYKLMRYMWMQRCKQLKEKNA